MHDLEYELDVTAAARRWIRVRLEFAVEVADRASARTAQGEVVLFLPVWTPGSYMVREFSRHLGPVSARDAASGAAIPVRKAAKNRVALAIPAGCKRVQVDYEVYAHELTVRTADLTAGHAYWNHACVLLWPVGARSTAARLRVLVPPEWDVACALPSERVAAGTFVLRGSSLDEVLDAPVLCGRFERIAFDVLGVPHEVILDGLGNVQPPAGFVADLQSIITRAAAVFDGVLPYPRYQFQCLFSNDGHGGLEHATSTTLLAARTVMRPGKDYQQFLALCAHEHFHSWNIKRMRPAELWDYDYEVENYTAMLWLAEGFTAYYDDHLCLRAGRIALRDWLELFGKTVTTAMQGAGRLRQSLADASFDAWIRLYRPDENTRNSTQNYYGNGAVAALLLDLEILRRSDGRRSLDDVLRHLYRTTFEAGRGYTLADVEASLRHAAGSDLGELLRLLVHGPLDPDLATPLRAIGLRLEAKDRDKPFVGVGFNSGTTVVAMVHDGSPAWHAGIAPGDELLAVADLRVTSGNWNDVLAAVGATGRKVNVLLASRGLVRSVEVQLGEHPVGTLQITEDADADADTLARRKHWLRA